MSERNGESNGVPDRRSVEEEAALRARLRHLGDALERERREAETASGNARAADRGDTSGMGLGFRLASELVAGVLVGGGLGWLLDRWLGTSPFGLIVLLLGGFAAGVLGILRATGQVKPSALDRDDGESGPPV